MGTKKEWESYVSKPLVRGQSKSASSQELSNAYVYHLTLSRVGCALTITFYQEIAGILRDTLLPKFFLRRCVYSAGVSNTCSTDARQRRTKELIKDQLPEKTDEVVFCPLAPIQLKAYKRILQTKAVRRLIGKDGPCDCGSKKSCVHRRFTQCLTLIIFQAQRLLPQV